MSFSESIFFTGTVKIRELPSWCRHDTLFLSWYTTLAEEEKNAYTVREYTNTLTASGYTQLLTYISSGNTMVQGFSQFFAVGSTPINTVQAGDTVVNGEFFRKAPTTTTIVGNQTTISTYFGPSEGNGVYTNGGFFGVNASGTIGSGTLMTHTLYSYTKTNGNAISNDYIITLA